LFNFMHSASKVWLLPIFYFWFVITLLDIRFILSNIPWRRRICRLYFIATNVVAALQMLLHCFHKESLMMTMKALWQHSHLLTLHKELCSFQCCGIIFENFETFYLKEQEVP
jgi:hypothetical protein